jgi:hypothetical protein
MAEGYNFERLRDAIFPLSQGDDWAAAKKEWELVHISQADPDEPETCLCGHHPILELCEIRNRLTDNTAIVGNQCVRRFLGMESEALFRGIRRIRKDNSKSMGADLAVWLFERGLISRWEYEFQGSTTRKRNLSDKQQQHRQRINQKALQAIKRRGVGQVE